VKPPIDWTWRDTVNLVFLIWTFAIVIVAICEVWAL
jgi:hypothetical protein